MTFQLLKFLKGGSGSRKAFLINLMARWLLSSLLDWLIGRSRETRLAKEISRNETGPALLVQPELCRPRLYVVRGQRALQSLQCDLSNAKSRKEWAMWSCKCIHMYTNTQLVQADMIAEHPSGSLTGKLCSVPISVLNVPVVPVVLVVLLVVVLVIKTTTTSWSLHPCMYSILFKFSMCQRNKGSENKGKKSLRVDDLPTRLTSA